MPVRSSPIRIKILHGISRQNKKLQTYTGNYAKYLLLLLEWLYLNRNLRNWAGWAFFFGQEGSVGIIRTDEESNIVIEVTFVFEDFL